MPLGNRRAMNLIEITGAAVWVDYDRGSRPNFSLAGGRNQSQMFWIDGGTGQNMRLGIGQVDVDPPIESLQEVKILANSFSAEYSGSAGGGIATTKSGTNQIRGTLSEYFRNHALNAPSFYAPIMNGKKSKPALRYNVFGGAVGDPFAAIIPSSFPKRVRVGETAPFAPLPCRQYCNGPAIIRRPITQKECGSRSTIRQPAAPWAAGPFATHFPATAFPRTASIRWQPSSSPSILSPTVRRMTLRERTMIDRMSHWI